MADNILVVDDDTLMCPNLAHRLEQAIHRSSPVSAEQALTSMRVNPPEVIFLTARRTKLDQVLRLEPGTDDTVAQPFNPHMQLMRIKAATADQLARTVRRGKQVWVPIAFAAGVLLLVLATPQWMAWARAVVAYELPTEDMVWNWLTNLIFDPAIAFDSLLAATVQTWLNPSQQMDAPMTMAIIVLAMASVAGLAQLLGDKHTTASA